MFSYRNCFFVCIFMILFCGCQHQRAHIRNLTPNDLFTDNKDAVTRKGGRMVRKGVIAAALANLNEIRHYFNKEINDKNKAIGSVNTLKLLIPDLIDLEMFEVFDVEDLLIKKDRPDRILFGVLYKNEIKSELSNYEIPSQVLSLISDSKKHPELSGITATDIIPDGQDYANFNGIPGRKGTIYSMNMNIKALATARTKEENEQYTKNLIELLPTLRALAADGKEIFEYFLLSSNNPHDPYKKGKEIMLRLWANEV